MTLAPDALRRLAAAHGFEVVSVTSGEELKRSLGALESWVSHGRHADMAWMARNPRERADANTLLDGVRSIVTVAVAHAHAAPPFQDEGRYGQVARYAWGLDYHDLLIPRLEALAAELTSSLGGARTRVACDHSPLLERAAAARAGLGFFGKNTCLIRPRHGSFFVLGEILLDRKLEPAPPVSGARHCGTCTRCLEACPTNAFVEPFVLDARRCISYLTIEHRGEIPIELRPSLGSWVFGCDTCQDVCPFNEVEAPTPWPELGPEAGVGPRLDLAETLALRRDGAFQARFAGTPLLRPRRRGLLRNAAVVARNVGAAAAVGALEAAVREDVEPLVRAHALWALFGLAPERARTLADRLRGHDDDPSVRAEACRGLEGAA